MINIVLREVGLGVSKKPLVEINQINAVDFNQFCFHGGNGSKVIAGV